MKMAGHLIPRPPEERLAKTAIGWMSLERKRKGGQVRKTLYSTFKEDLRRLDITWKEAYRLARDRDDW